MPEQPLPDRLVEIGAEAYRARLGTYKAELQQAAGLCDAVAAENDELRGRLAAVTAERDALLDRWPEDGIRGVFAHRGQGGGVEWMCYPRSGVTRAFASRRDAVRCVAGLDRGEERSGGVE